MAICRRAASGRTTVPSAALLQLDDEEPVAGILAEPLPCTDLAGRLTAEHRLVAQMCAGASRVGLYEDRPIGAGQARTR